MKKYLIFTFLTLCAFLSAFTAEAQSQKIPAEMIPVFVEEMNKSLPQEIDNTMVFSKV